MSKVSELKSACSWGAVLALIFWSAASHAFAVEVDEFSVVRNGSAFFSDSFDDGVVPPSGPRGSATYNVFGSIPGAAESGGHLLLDTANGGVFANALGTPRREVRVRLLTNIDPASPAGLKSDDTIALTGIFKLTTPSGVWNPLYSVRFNDNSGSGPHQILQLLVGVNSLTQLTDIRYILQDFDAHTITVLGQTAFAPTPGADEILLSISRPDSSSDDFYASYSYLQDSVVVGGGSFNTPGQMFQGEDFVRAEFNVADGYAPEPGSVSLMGLAAFLLFVQRRRGRF